MSTHNPFESTPKFDGSGSDCRDRFKPTADAYRRISRILRLSSCLLILFWPLVLIPKNSVYANYRIVGVAGIVTCVFGILIGSLIWLPRLTCPSCHGRMDPRRGLGGNGIGPYCPECGAAAIEDAFLDQKCTACNKALRNRHGRSYKIRYCTRCDAHVDDLGV
ncbi:MAG: hypothetical protein WAN79_04335 [Opitutaceae bacterium]